MEQELIIEAGRTERQYWKDLWRYRELFIMLSWRDIAVRYKQTVIGIAWAVLRPFLTMLAFTIVFGKIAKLPSEGSAPYALMVFAAMLPWQLFATALTSTSDSLVVNANLISKIYFPRLLIPASTVGVAFVDFIISLGLLALLLVWYQYLPTVRVLAVIPLGMLVGILSLGPGLILSSLNAKYRDFRYAVPFITMFGLYISPVGFSISIVPEKWRLLFECNPMVGIIEGFRWALLGTMDLPVRALAISAIAAVLLLITGIRIFRTTERTFADII